MPSGILAQRSVGSLGQVTSAFRHFFRVATSRFEISILKALKWYQEQLATRGVQPTCQKPGLATRLLQLFIT